MPKRNCNKLLLKRANRSHKKQLETFNKTHIIINKDKINIYLIESTKILMGFIIF